jgi:hypothetical protein
VERAVVYLDSNVIIDIFEGRDDELLGLLFRSIYSGPYCYPFSAELISEITDPQYPDRNNKRMLLVADLSRRFYFENSFTKIGFRNENPETVFNTINEVDIGFNYNSHFANLISFEQIIGVREAFGLDSKSLNGMEPLAAIKHIDRALANFDYQETSGTQKPPRSLKDMISAVSSITEESFKDVGTGLGKKAEHDAHRKDIIMFFSLLDTFGYWGDPRQKYKRGSRLCDAQHALVGSHFSAIVSRDVHFVNKARAAYEYMGINTKTFTTNDFKTHLKEIVVCGR